jgi:tRNA dimethylallyltransferase
MTDGNSALSRCVCIAGPTASGKTAAALAVAQHLQATWPVEIISVDSALVYTGMDIGTAKPNATELASAPHHLIDICDPQQPYSAARFVKDATRLIGEITARGHLPLLVGGTMLYFKALFDGLDDMPTANTEIRAALEQEAALVGWPAMHVKLAEVDPITAARLQANDAQRIHRALEVYRISGQPMSSFHKRLEATNFTINNIATQAVNTLAIGQFKHPNLLFISLEPTDRAWLHQRIKQRFDAMLINGFEEEVHRLRARGDLDLDTPSMRCVGYRQMWEALDAIHAAKNFELDKNTALKNMNEMREKGIAATRQLCKRQLTWLRSMPQRQVLPCDSPDALARVLAAVDAWV